MSPNRRLGQAPAMTSVDAAAHTGPTAPMGPTGPTGPEHLDVLIVGAGLSGIGAACHLRREHPGRSVAILEARDAIGGTWDLFRYPGVRSDTDMFTLGYAFAPWTGAKAIADGASVREYIRRTAGEYGVDRLVRYRHRVVRAEWSSAEARWTVTAELGDPGGPGGGGGTVTLTCRFLYACSGYYRYDRGHTPDFPGVEDFAGRLVHPQLWPEDLDHTGKRVVVIGSGATAVTLVPSLAARAAKVTMLQRSPTYLVSLPARDVLADTLRRALPPRTANRIVRWKNIRVGLATYRLARRAPRLARRLLIAGVRRSLPAGYDVATHFTPRYAPWDERLCAVPDADLFRAIRSGRAEVVTDRIGRFTPDGLRLESGAELPADIVVTATGLSLLALGGMRLAVDGREIELGRHVAYRAMMLSDVPNFAFTIGYTNAAWTLKADLVARYVCRLLAHLDGTGQQVVTPVAPATLEREPLIGLSSGYVRRALEDFPSQGTTAPWRVHQNYPRDRRTLAEGPAADGALRFSSPAAAGPAGGDGPRTVTVDGRRVRYRDTGTGRPVLLIHGLARSLEDWSEQHRLLGEGHRVISLDLPGFGGSERLPGPTTLPALAAAVRAFLDEVGVREPVRVAGNSLGGAVAMRLAVDAPDRVHSLLLAGSAGFGREVTAALRILAVRPLGRMLLSRPGRSAVARAERAIFHDPSFATTARIEHALRLADRPGAADAMLEVLADLGSPRGAHEAWRRTLLAGVGALGLPVFVVWGDRDRVLPARHLAAARVALPKARTRLFRATGHMPQIERAEDFAELALDFWA
ncbi:alpha/beta fold hydrolase [Kitasatospora sp. NPDC058032]|uniref:alpha/beta fold hydrolase n=1 Tax=Kitasatospora sp. NPDC058032 TaxID=3346307 RepID=UPI0036DAFC40